MNVRTPRFGGGVWMKAMSTLTACRLRLFLEAKRKWLAVVKRSVLFRSTCRLGVEQLFLRYAVVSERDYSGANDVAHSPLTPRRSAIDDDDDDGNDHLVVQLSEFRDLTWQVTLSVCLSVFIEKLAIIRHIRRYRVRI